MKAIFTNFTDEEFEGFWDGRGRKYPPGKSEKMPDFLARHFAKHLTNKELLRTNKKGDLVHKNGDKMTSPKRPEDAPMFMELFNKAYTPIQEQEIIETKQSLADMVEEVSEPSTGELQTPVDDEDDFANKSKK